MLRHPPQLTLNSLHVECVDLTLATYLRDLGVAPISLQCQTSHHETGGWAAQDGSHIIATHRSQGRVGGHPRTNNVVFKTRNMDAFSISCSHDRTTGLRYAITQNPALPGIRWVLVETGDTEVAVEYEPACGRFHLDTLVQQLHQAATSSILTFDHLACVVNEGNALPVADWLIEVFGFIRHKGDGEDEAGQLVMMGDGALRMVTVRHGDFYVVLAEPVPGYAGQVRDFLCAHGPGVQHMALKAGDIVNVAKSARASGRLNFAVPPASAWEEAVTDAAGSGDMLDLVIARKENQILTKVRTVKDPVAGLSQPTGLLSQLFTAPLSTHTHLFLELIERRNFDGFAVANINNLFASQHVDLSILFVDETLGAELLVNWAKTTTDFTVAITMLQCKTEDDLLRYLAHTSKYFSVIVSSFVPVTSSVFAALIRAPVLVCAQGIGYNHIDFEAARKLDVGVCNNGKRRRFELPFNASRKGDRRTLN
ncbi:hypothetical protein HDU89_006647 [Geranomyces variabilis]|nr:hypothetical protein HDU89_006647 [Geranomyces variabilis]